MFCEQIAVLVFGGFSSSYYCSRPCTNVSPAVSSIAIIGFTLVNDFR